jgi:hypothetical protein
MNYTFMFLLSTILLSSFFIKEIKAQNDTSQKVLINQIYSAAELEYGIDQNLVNGVYFENLYQYTIGHPYLLANTFINGSVVFRGNQYSDLLLKYDLFNQQLLVNYAFNDIHVLFYLPKEFISEFIIENKIFVKRSIPGEVNDRIYQIIGKDYPTKILYTWEKIGTDFIYYFEYGEANRSSFIVIGSNQLGYNRNRSFIHKFPKQHQKLIKKYIHENKIRVKYSSDYEMDLLITYCNKLD